MTASTQTPAARLVAELERKGIRLWLSGEELRCSGPDVALSADVLALLRDRREELLDALRGAAGATGSASRPADLPLSFAQQRLWFLEQMPQEKGVYNVPLAVSIRGALDLAALARAFERVVHRHEILRTRFVAESGQPAQRIAPPEAVPIETVELAAAGPDDERVRALLVQEASAPFDLAREAPLRVKLLRLGPERAVLCVTLHHIACDGASLDILLEELARFYRAALLDLDADLPPLPQQYADYAQWQHQHLDRDRLDAQMSYWQQQLAAPLPALELPADRPRAKLQSHHGAVVQFRLPRALARTLAALGQRGSASFFMTLLAAFKVLLYRYTGETDVVVGVPVSHRPRRELERLIGLFVNTVVLRTRLRPQGSFLDLLAEVRRVTLDALAHQDLPFEKLIEVLQPDRDLSRNPIFQIKFRLEHAPPARIELPGLVLERLPQALSQAKLDLSMDLYETDDGVAGGLEFDTALFDGETIARMAGHFETLAGDIAEHPERPLCELALLSPGQRTQQLLEWNDTARPYAQETCFHLMVEAVASARPDDTALIFDGPPVATLSYGELNRRANRLAHWLQRLGVGPEVVVGIGMDRGLDMIVAVLGVLKAGGAYLPLDAAYPLPRLEFMLSDAQVPVLLSHSSLTLPAGPLRLNLDEDWPADLPEHDPQRVSRPQHLAYVIYTSGSTGRPKGVLIQHQGLVNLTEDKIRVCDVRPRDCVLQFFSFSFDASIPEIVMSLAAGARLLLAPAQRLLPGPELADLIERHGVTHVTMTPSALVGLPPRDYPSLRMVLVGGEAPSVGLMSTWSRGRVFINAYGPTETTVNASMVACGNGHPLAATLRPSANKQLYVLDDNLALLPVGAPGELCIAGVGLARGYLHRPDLTARQFVPNPFRGTDTPGRSEYLYRTGDLACLLPDGRIRLLGRIDDQVKVRGFRVEPGDVEHVIARHPGVKAAMVLALDDGHGGKRLAAFGVAHGGDVPTPAEMRRYAGEHLPHFMRPASFTWLPALPLTPNGKIDTRALATLEGAHEAPAAAPPRNDIEAGLLAIFREALERTDLGIEDDFFEAGGHSLLATRLVARVQAQLAVEITVVDLFEAATVAALGQRVAHKQKLARLEGAAPPGGEREEISL